MRAAAESGRLYYRPEEAARLTGLSLRTVWRRVRTGDWRSRTDGRCRLILADDVEGRSAPRSTAEPAISEWTRDALARVR